MGSFSIWHWAIVIVVVALLFGGKGKLSGLMGDAAKGIKAFKEGLKDEDTKDGPHERRIQPAAHRRGKGRAEPLGRPERRA